MTTEKFSGGMEYQVRPQAEWFLNQRRGPGIVTAYQDTLFPGYLTNRSDVRDLQHRV
jgi:hypothetical protein